MSSFLMFVTYKKFLFFRGSMLSAYSFNTPLLYDVMLKIVKTHQELNPWYILLKEVTHVFTLECNYRLFINHISSLLLRVRK